MTDSANNHKKFSVVQFIALPFEGIDDYVCVPDEWVVIRRKQDQKVVVAYPKDEDRFVTRDRVKREEKYDDDWKFWTAEVKREFDDFKEADFWIATRNDYGPLVSQNSSLNDTPSTSTLNKKFRSSKQKSKSKSKKDTPEMTQKPFQIARKPLPRTTIKRPASDESKPQLEKKRVKQSTTKAAEPTGAGSQITNEEPGCSSMSAIIEDEPLVIDIDEDDHVQQNQQSSENNNNSQNHLVIDMTAAQNHLQDNGNSSSNFQPQIASIQSLATTSNNQEPHADDSTNNGPSTSQHEPESIATELYKKMKGKPSLKAKHPAEEKKMRLENITRKVAILLKNPPNSTNQHQPRREPRVVLPPSWDNRFIHPGDMPVNSQEIQHVARINIERIHNSIENPRNVLENVASVVSAPLNLPGSPQQHPSFARQLDGQQNSLAPDQHTQQTTRRQNLVQRLIEEERQDRRLRLENRLRSAANDLEHLSTERPVPVFDPSSRINRSPSTFNARERMQRILNQRVAHIPTCAYRRPVSTTTLPRSMRSNPLPQETVRTTPSLLFPNLPDSIRRELLVTHSNFLSEEEELQGHLAQGTPIIETHPDTIVNSGIPVQANLYQNPRMQTQMVDHSNGRNQVYFQDDIDRSSSASDSGVGMDHDGISNYRIPAEEARVETTNNINHSQGNLRFVSQQQMKDQFANTSAQMGSTLKYMVNVFENLRTSILETAASYQTLLENMERFNRPENSVNQASTSRNVAQEVPQVAEEREITAAGNADFNGDQDRNDVVNDAPERNPNPRSRLTLPPEYDPNDTRWTLKNLEHRPGFVELMPHSNIYVNYGELKYCEEISSDCPSLARRILPEVFSKTALSVCSSMTERGHDYSIYPAERPKLNEHGCLVLLNYILEHGLQRGWKTDMQPILRALHDKVKEIRFRFGAMSRC